MFRVVGRTNAAATELYISIRRKYVCAIDKRCTPGKARRGTREKDRDRMREREKDRLVDDGESGRNLLLLPVKRIMGPSALYPPPPLRDSFVTPSSEGSLKLHSLQDERMSLSPPEGILSSLPQGFARTISFSASQPPPRAATTTTTLVPIQRPSSTTRVPSWGYGPRKMRLLPTMPAWVHPGDVLLRFPRVSKELWTKKLSGLHIDVQLEVGVFVRKMRREKVKGKGQDELDGRLLGEEEGSGGACERRIERSSVPGAAGENLASSAD
ncbi:hypothetical protein WN55_01306 [Dufourea novaeangliae]|uniref:Uncharacterized protein n=1 Tax=Dufourea novaeangliae TaxID=178035 RepID=A0A154PD00_DUFNO|nr:hypothetical protein WN55_01306 [Dufourea novaeangliae]